MPARRSSLLSPTALLRRNALYRGALGGNRSWMLVGAVLWGPKVIKRIFGKHEQVLTIERLVPGEAVRIEAIRPPTRRERKAARRAG